ncbi:MAG: pilus assembly protein PilM [Synergistaceae bacterium]|nr:pilus assembly protein PilM [Synergistaceae bacterium]
MFKIKTAISSEISAAMAIHDEFIYFIEIDENNDVRRKITVPMPDGCIINGQIKNFDSLKNAFFEVRRSIGKINIPVCIGLPEGETIIRFPSFPDMSIEDIRGTLDLNFTEYFPYSREEAVFDVIKIKTPGGTNKNITVLAASARKQTVEQVLAAAHDAGITAGPVEPLNFAMIRALPEAYEGLCVVADKHNIVAIWNGDGIYFRIADTSKSTQDIFNTIRYVETQYRGVQVNKIILLGSEFEVAGGSSDSGPRVIADRDEYYAARGLAMRNAPGFPAIDMRPIEFIEIEKRRYSFSVYKLILWVLILIFFMFSIGTISYTLLCIQDINDQMALLRDSVQDLTPQRIALTRQNSELEQQNAETEKILRFLKNDIPALEILNELEDSAGIQLGVHLADAEFVHNDSGRFVVTINGKAENEPSLLESLKKLNDSKKFREIKLPVSQQDETGQVNFTLILEFGGDA